jgi:NAD-specific glutamate dehydrogenase
VKHATAIADLFIQRFNPVKPMSDEELKRCQQELFEAVEKDVSARDKVLDSSVHANGHTS